MLMIRRFVFPVPGGTRSIRISARFPLPQFGAFYSRCVYLVAKQDMRQVVLYWFQTLTGVYTFEQQLRLPRIVDAVRLNRTDMALVRVVVPVTASGIEAASRNATALAASAYLQMLPYFRNESGK